MINEFELPMFRRLFSHSCVPVLVFVCCCFCSPILGQEQTKDENPVQPTESLNENPFKSDEKQEAEVVDRQAVDGTEVADSAVGTPQETEGANEAAQAVVKKRKPVRIIKQELRLSNAAISNDGSIVAVTGSGFPTVVNLFDSITGDETCTFKSPFGIMPCRSLVFSPSGDKLGLLPGSGEEFGLFELSATGRKIESCDKLTGSRMPMYGLGFARDVPLVTFSNMRGKIHVHDYEENVPFAEVQLASYSIGDSTQLHLSARGGHLHVFGGNSIQLIDTGEKKTIQRMELEKSQTSSFNCDGTKLVQWTSRGGRVWVTDVNTGKKTATSIDDSISVAFRGEENDVVVLTFGGVFVLDGKTLEEKASTKWNPESFYDSKKVGNHTFSNNIRWSGIKVSRDGTRLVAHEQNGKRILIIDLPE